MVGGGDGSYYINEHVTNYLRLILSRMSLSVITASKLLEHSKSSTETLPLHIPSRTFEGERKMKDRRGGRERERDV